MTTPRAQQVDLSATPYYHVVSRCVRRAFLCGTDKFTGNNFDHRRGWLVERFRFLAGAFAIDCCAFACMSNHYHLILHIDRDRALRWSDDEVVRRWGHVCTGGAAYRYSRGQTVSESEQLEIVAKTPLWRRRLHDLSWFMKLLNEYIARQANKEDDCRGHFWESRFKSQALLDERAILAAMTYVDLNPIRAGAANSLVESQYTSVQERIVSRAKEQAPSSAIAAQTLPYRIDTLPRLMPFADAASCAEATDNHEPTLPCTFSNYLALVEWTGKQLRNEGQRAPAAGMRSVLLDLGMEQEEWLCTVRSIRHRFAFAIGGLDALQRWRDKLQRRWVRGSGRKSPCSTVAST